MASGPVYLDHNATTPVHPAARSAMLPWLGERWGNPSSGHVHGREAREAVAQARAQVAALIGAQPQEIRFTAGGTEADNLVVLGVGPDRGGRLMTSSVEHPAVALPAQLLIHGRDWVCTELPVDARGRVDLKKARPRISDPASGRLDLLSVILVQNETGVIQPVGALSRFARMASRGVVIHTDAAQAAGKIPINVAELDVDMMTVVSHKLHGPPGVGALYVREGVAPPRPLLYGGGQEGGLRPGTEPVALIVGFGKACACAMEDLEQESRRVLNLRERLFAALVAEIPALQRTARSQDTVPGTLHLRFPGVSGAELLSMTPEIAASTGSACHTGGSSPSVLAAMGVPASEAHGAVRLSLGRLTREWDIGPAARALVRSYRQLQAR